ncbi:uncharacterized protein ARMOST_02254 [Armillaria ostoyae]|uniref:Uncharacterized protein n=1 Tax=Armillaria ostoyae TaxID=47428 RepID=A0A284QR66_ARMOS|nr:uncharacterized protein ARMOST_02254 [Armillaria ostoyae]
MDRAGFQCTTVGPPPGKERRSESLTWAEHDTAGADDITHFHAGASFDATAYMQILFPPLLTDVERHRSLLVVTPGLSFRRVQNTKKGLIREWRVTRAPDTFATRCSHLLWWQITSTAQKGGLVIHVPRAARLSQERSVRDNSPSLAFRSVLTAKATSGCRQAT